VESGRIRLVLTGTLKGDDEIAAHHARHGDGVHKIALSVPDAAAAYEHAVSHGARGVHTPQWIADDLGRVQVSSVATYGDTLHLFVQREDYEGAFLPGFAARAEAQRDLVDAVAVAGVVSGDLVVALERPGQHQADATGLHDVRDAVAPAGLEPRVGGLGEPVRAREEVGGLRGVADEELDVVDAVDRHAVLDWGLGWRSCCGRHAVHDRRMKATSQQRFVAKVQHFGLKWTTSTVESLRCFARTPAARSRTSATTSI
jgi:hypothetical protein